MIGTVIAERYRIERELGTGSMGQVYEAVRLRDSLPVALKLLRPELGDELRARFVREGKALALFDHPNIVRFVEAGLAPSPTAEDPKAELHYLATELIRGVTLRELMEAGPIDSQRALSITRQVLEALGHVHSLGVVHRDLKPENIMLVDGGKPDSDSDLVKMLDFGVAKLASDTAAVLEENKLTRTGFEAFGTALYMPPEVALGRSVEPRSDLYAVGAILFEMLAGRPLFDEQDVVVLMRKHATTKPPTLAEAAPHVEITPELELLLAEALAKQPGQRYASTTEMISALDLAVRSLVPLPAAPAPHLEPTIKAPVEPPSAAPRDGTLQFAPPPVRAETAPVAPLPPPRAPGAAVPWYERLTPTAKRNAAIGAGALLLVIIVAVAASGGSSSTAAAAGSAKTAGGGAASGELATQGLDLLAAGNVVGAVEHLESGLAKAPNTADAHLALGHARLKLGQRTAAIGAYERALKLDKSLGSDPKLAGNLATFFDGKDTVAAVIALELAVAIEQREVVVAQASKSKQLDVRQRAMAIAEREGFANEVDRVESWSADLAQVQGCEAKRALVAKLRGTDARALPALRRARATKCIESDVAEAITFLETSP